MPRMTQTRTEPEVIATATALRDVETELLVVPVREGDGDAGLEDIDTATGGELGRARRDGEFRAKPNELFITPVVDSTWKPRRAALLGLGSGGDDLQRRLRSASAALAIEARRRRIGQTAVVLSGISPADLAGQAVTEGLLLGGFEDRRYKTATADQMSTPPLTRCELLVDTAHLDAVADQVNRGVVLGASANLARELANEPANVLTPRVFAERAEETVLPHGIDVEILEEDAIRELGMGLLLGVSQGSVEPPRLLVMRHTPSDPAPDRVLGLVGKGVTFDSGGLSLKTPDGMERMKQDMAGGAAVIGAMRAIGALQIPVEVVAVVPMTENMPGRQTTRPGDILTSASGLTVEVLNTDAEGRLILADALWYAGQLGATHLVDVATLTGACVIALGKVCSGLFGQPSGWVDELRAAGERSGERVWPLPLYDEYRDQLRSEMADLTNVGGRPAGACTAASFLHAFAGGLPWAHLDVAGTAWAEESRPDQAKGATGVMVRTLAELASHSTDW